MLNRWWMRGRRMWSPKSNRWQTRMSRPLSYSIQGVCHKKRPSSAKRPLLTLKNFFGLCLVWSVKRSCGLGRPGEKQVEMFERLGRVEYWVDTCCESPIFYHWMWECETCLAKEILPVIADIDGLCRKRPLPTKRTFNDFHSKPKAIIARARGGAY